jgi:hypothetical protein
MYEPADALAMLEGGINISSVVMAAFAENYEKYTDVQRQELLDGVVLIARGDKVGHGVQTRRAVRSAFSILNGLYIHPKGVAPEVRESLGD